MRLWPGIRDLFAGFDKSLRVSGCAADWYIASTTAANDLPLCTRNPNDFAGLEGILTVKIV